MRPRLQFLACAVLVVSSSASAGEAAFELTVSAGKHDRENTPVRVKLPPGKLAEGVKLVTLTGEDGQALLGQVAGPGLIDEAKRKDDEAEAARYLHFILPKLAAGESATFAVQEGTGTLVAPPFRWEDTPKERMTLIHGERLVARYMYLPLLETSPNLREETYKPYHHLYTPDGSRYATKGPGGQYTHHRGLFYGFNRVSYGEKGEKQADVWHCANDAHQLHQEFLEMEAGPVFARQRVRIDWHGPKKEVFASEQREFTFYAVPSGQLVEFASRLSSKAGDVRLDGDPQHAGFHFRADDEVASKTNKQTYYLRPDGKGQPGETRNWDAQSRDPKTVNLPWNAMSFVLGDQRYTALYLDHPENPKEARYSERDYGRFGSYFEYDLKEDQPLVVNYRLWLQDGEMTGEKAEALSASFTEPVETSLLR